ncbi:hypothetical protein LTR86_007206 [Recurvomyces mirabilis]|nr:hypothetical protein LTR86_007206 [Recurvomyces mirabilis]
MQTLIRAIGVFTAIGTLATSVLAVSLPACQLTAPTQQNITSHVITAKTVLPENNLPFGIVYSTRQPNTAFVALNDSLGVLDTSNLAPRLAHQVSFPSALQSELDKIGGVGGSGVALSHDGRYLFVTAFSPGLLVLDTARAAVGRNDSFVALLNGTAAAGNTAIEVTISPDDRYAYVSQENGIETVNLVNGTYKYASQPGRVETFALYPPRKGCEEWEGYTGRSLGFYVLGVAVVGTALSPDGMLLYATSENKTTGDYEGSLSVLCTRKLKMNATDALVAEVDAGCSPVRTLVSPNGEVVWVTARSSNALLAFNASEILTNGNASLIASISVGTQPVGLAFVKNGGRVVTANSDRSTDPNAVTGLSVVDVQAALAGKAYANLGQVDTGAFPRELAVSGDGKTLLVSDYSAASIQAVDVGSLP